MSLITIAVGGTASVPPGKSAAFPQPMLIDYIRVCEHAARAGLTPPASSSPLAPHDGSVLTLMTLGVRRVRGAAGDRERWLAFYRHAAGVIGRYKKTVIDCPDPRALATFYCQVLGMRVNEDSDGWVVIGSEPGLRELAFQRVTGWVPPRWPDPAHPQQLHLDIRVDDADQAEQELRALGATRASGKPETGFRVFIDPAGHPFCIVFGRHSAG